ncbi:DUF805 domain-containing protein [Kocuria sp. ZOR0020]|uniref:DUF805 domain-containing protein n=1 Tax=Kocuria sp. ZOR0020 TaxID=1339234 RepID=UPI00068E0EB0|nr:DUF805 domain-containing protein [Kocuria sp. ZOR0020]
MSYGINPQEPDSQNGAPQPAGQSPYSQPSAGNNAVGHGAQGYPVGSQPGEQVNFMGAMKNFFRKYTQFSGRASRSEFWWAYLGQSLIFLALLALFIIALVTMISSADPYTNEPSGGALAFYLLTLALIGLVSLALLVPTIAVTVRRLHDTNRSGWFYFISFVPMVGGIILLVLCAGEPDPAGAAYDA